MKKINIFLLLFLCFGVTFAQPWTEQVSGVTTQLTSISVIDNLNGWICGYSGVVLRTTNRGTNWLNVSGNGIPATIQLINIFGISQTTALTAGYIGSNTWVYSTTNAGANWVQVFTQIGGFINAVHIGLDGTGLMMATPSGADGHYGERLTAVQTGIRQGCICLRREVKPAIIIAYPLQEAEYGLVQITHVFTTQRITVQAG
ncbi:MAG: YCF48-related protein [Chlorobi bacterium]|nr:YCF48-related protein [Chlorobiota bacterium]